jgi:hypothetical protein
MPSEPIEWISPPPDLDDPSYFDEVEEDWRDPIPEPEPTLFRSYIRIINEVETEIFGGDILLLNIPTEGQPFDWLAYEGRPIVYNHPRSIPEASELYIRFEGQAYALHDYHHLPARLVSGIIRDGISVRKQTIKSGFARWLNTPSK